MTSFSIAWMKIQEFALTAKKKNANEAESRIGKWQIMRWHRENLSSPDRIPGRTLRSKGLVLDYQPIPIQPIQPIRQRPTSAKITFNDLEAKVIGFVVANPKKCLITFGVILFVVCNTAFLAFEQQRALWILAIALLWRGLLRFYLSWLLRFFQSPWH